MPPRKSRLDLDTDDEAVPESPLTSVIDSDAPDDEDIDEPGVEARPSKRIKTNDNTAVLSAGVGAIGTVDPDRDPGPALEGMSDVSSDTEGDIPSSPSGGPPRFEEDDSLEQVISCAWDGCEAGDLGDMDNLVNHIHNKHIESRLRKYNCEWIGCSRKGMSHASGYALKAHMRSHTREKPFYCYLPECDRSFTRSDALAKHMRTVHETEALRPSDPIPKSMQPPTTGRGKLKIILKTPQSHGLGHDTDGGDDDNDEIDRDFFTPLPEDQFSKEELKWPIDDLYQKCRYEVRWAEEEGERLRKEIKEVDDICKAMWLDKETILAQVIQGELDWHERRNAIKSGVLDVHVSGVVHVSDDEGAAGKKETNTRNGDDIEDGESKKKATNGAEHDTSTHDSPAKVADAIDI